MSASMTFSKAGLDNIAKIFRDPVIKEELERLPQSKDVVAIVAQAIADNFNKEGPGWAPLKADTIRGSVSKAKYKELKNLSDEDLLEYEKKSRSSKSENEPNRRILRRTGLLMKSVTVPGAKGNVWRTEGSHLIWGTDLVYAGIHNHGGVIRPKNKKVLHWKSNTGDHFAKQVTIPQRKFLTLREEWKKQLNDFLIGKILKVVRERLTKGGS